MLRKLIRLIAFLIAIALPVWLGLAAAQDRVMRRPLYPVSTFLPSDLSNLKAWYRANTISGKSDGDLVASWADDSGSGNPLYDKADSAKSPTYKTNQINSLPALSFDGTSDELRTGASGVDANFNSGASVHTIFMVLQDNTTDTSSGHPWLVYDNSGTPVWNLQRYTPSTTARIVSWNTGASAFACSGTVSNGTASPGDWHIISAVIRTSDNQIYVDGVASTATSTTGTNNSGAQPLWMGAEFECCHAKVKIAEAYIYASALSDTDRHSNESYLSSKYGISVSVQ